MFGIRYLVRHTYSNVQCLRNCSRMPVVQQRHNLTKRSTRQLDDRSSYFQTVQSYEELRHLIPIDSKNVDSSSLTRTFQALRNAAFVDDPLRITSMPEFETFCSIALKKSSCLDVQEVITVINCLVHLRVDVNVTLMAALLKMLGQNLNELEFKQIVFLNNLLGMMKVISGNGTQTATRKLVDVLMIGLKVRLELLLNNREIAGYELDPALEYLEKLNENKET